MSRSVLLCGLGRVGWRVLDSLRSTGATVTVIDRHANPADPRLAGVTLVVGDCRQPDVLERAGVRTVSGVLVVTSDDLVNVGTALLARRLNPDARLVVRMFNQNLLARLGDVLKNAVALSVSALTAPLFALTAVSGESLAAFPVGAKSQQIAAVEVADGSPLLARTIQEVANERKLMVLALARSDEPPRLMHELDPATQLSVGDKIVVSGSPTALAPLLSNDPAGVKKGGGLKWAGRVLLRTLAAIDRPVKIATFALLLTLAVAVIVFRVAGDSWADSFFNTVNVAATGAELKGENREWWVKLFLGGLKLGGAALLAAFTAIFTNYLLRAKLGEALQERRIPEGGHVVVCGLGNVGYRCVQELLALGVPVVAVELSADAPFVSTVRGMGAAVVVGNATVPETLAQARAATARAVIAATASELANLEIALLVREKNPTQRVVVRMADPDFAEAARSAAAIRHALSPPALAAPAFATALLGDRIQALVPVGVRMLAVVELVADAGDELTDRTLHELMIDHKLLPLGLAGAEPFAEGGIPKGTRLAVGAKLTAVLELADLERMLRREAVPADCGVIVDDVPLTATAALVPLVATARGCSPEEAAKLLEAKSFTLVEGVTRGRAEEVLSRLTRERVGARVVQR